MKFALVFLVFLNSFLYSSDYDIINQYRLHGIENIEKKIELQLEQKEYWDYYLASKDTSKGYYESIEYIMICQKELKNITLYNTKKKEKVFSSDVFTGKLNGDKNKEGDLRTPVGAYRLTKRLTKVDPFYGPLALTTNYPNLYDKIQGKTGHGIWIHGFPLTQKRDDFTKGCIALDNTKIKQLDNSINIYNSILIISENNFANTLKNDISTILANLYKWRNAWKYNDLTTYLSFYDKSFIRSDNKNLEQFKKYKKAIFNRGQKKIIKFSKINIIPYPNNENKKLFKIQFNELYKTKSYKFQGKKKLYIELKNDKFSILTES